MISKTIIRKLETYISTRAIVVQENKASEQGASKFIPNAKKIRIPNSPYAEFGSNNESSIQTYTKEGRLSSMYIKHGEKYYTSSHGNVELTLARTKNVLVTISLLQGLLTSSLHDSIPSSQISIILGRGNDFNNELNTIYGKGHRKGVYRTHERPHTSYLGILCHSIWHAMRTQSEATRVFESCHDILQEKILSLSI